MNNFWEKLEKPFFVLAPMANVTDAAFRRVIAKYGRPDVMWTEFVSCDGLCHPDGREAIRIDLSYTEEERPIVAQVFTTHPDKMREAAKYILELGFDGIDINMGCPDKNVMKQGAGASLMKNPELAKELVLAAKEGVENKIPVSVKTRIGFNSDELEDWLPSLIMAKPAAITVHARTKKEMSLVPANWDRVKRAVEIAQGSGVLILGNGDVKNLEEARARVAETGCDGVMIGRGIFGNPWLFADVARVRRGCHIEHPAASSPSGEDEIIDIKNTSKSIASQSRNRPNTLLIGECDAEKSIGEDGAGYIPMKEVTTEEKLRVMVEHTKLYEELFKDKKSFELMKKHYKAYVHGFPEAKELRVKLMNCHTALEVEKATEEFLKKSF
jgi:nifR3 family TIM-barrel protein